MDRPPDQPRSDELLPSAYGLTVEEALTAPSLQGSLVLAGKAGLDRIIRRLNIMEVPDILPWTKPDEFLLTTGYPVRDDPSALTDLLPELAAGGLAGIGVKIGRYVDAIPDEALRRADELNFPVIRLPDDVSFDDILNQLLTEILNRQAAVLARVGALHQSLLTIVLEGGGLDEITAGLSTAIGRPTSIVDEDFGVVASAGGDDVEPAAAQELGDNVAHVRRVF